MANLTKRQQARHDADQCIVSDCANPLYDTPRGRSMRCVPHAAVRSAAFKAYRDDNSCTRCLRRPRQDGQEICAICERGGVSLLMVRGEWEKTLTRCLTRQRERHNGQAIIQAALRDVGERLVAMRRMRTPIERLERLILEAFEEAERMAQRAPVPPPPPVPSPDERRHYDQYVSPREL